MSIITCTLLCVPNLGFFMVDEGDAAVAARAPLTASGETDSPADAPEAEAEAVGGAEKSPRRRSASPPPSAGSDAPRLAGSLRAPLSAGQSGAGAPNEERERSLESASQRACICPPLWKVCLRATPPNDKPSS